MTSRPNQAGTKLNIIIYITLKSENMNIHVHKTPCGVLKLAEILNLQVRDGSRSVSSTCTPCKTASGRVMDAERSCLSDPHCSFAAGSLDLSRYLVTFLPSFLMVREFNSLKQNGGEWDSDSCWFSCFSNYSNNTASPWAQCTWLTLSHQLTQYNWFNLKSLT